MRPFQALAAASVLAAAPALAEDIARTPTDKSVADAVAALTAAVEGAGARVFATVDHGAGARSIGSDIGDSVLVVFGNPKVGTPVIAMDRLAGLFLPLKVLVYADADGQTWLAYEAPAAMLSGTAADTGSEAVGRLAGALGNLTAAAAK